MANAFHIDLLSAYSGGDTTTSAFPVKTGANSLNITASDLDGGTLTLEFRPIGSSEWYSKATGTFTVAELDANNKAWVNTFLGEGHVRAVLSGTSEAAVVEEMLLRPTHESEIDL